MTKASVLIDGGYLSMILRHVGATTDGSPMAIDHERLSDSLLRNDEERIRTYYYTCRPYQSNPPTSEEKERYRRHNQFIFNLRRNNRFEVRFGRLKKTNGEFEQKRVDVLLSVDLVRMSWGKLIDRVVVATADSDFVPAIEAAKEAGVVTRLAYSTELPVNNELLEAFDERLEISRAVLLKCRLNGETTKPRSLGASVQTSGICAKCFTSSLHLTNLRGEAYCPSCLPEIEAREQQKSTVLVRSIAGESR